MFMWNSQEAMFLACPVRRFRNLYFRVHCGGGCVFRVIIVAADVSRESRLICFRPHSHPSLLTITYWMGSGLHSPGVNMCMVGVHVSGGWASSHPLYGFL